VLDHARVLLHQPHIDASRGALSDLALEAIELTRLRDEADEVLARCSGRTITQLREDTDRALVLVGAAAVEYGIADEVAQPSSSAELERNVPLRPSV